MSDHQVSGEGSGILWLLAGGAAMYFFMKKGSGGGSKKSVHSPPSINRQDAYYQLSALLKNTEGRRMTEAEQAKKRYLREAGRLTNEDFGRALRGASFKKNTRN